MKQVLPSMVYQGVPKRNTIPEPCFIREAPYKPYIQMAPDLTTADHTPNITVQQAPTEGTQPKEGPEPDILDETQDLVDSTPYATITEDNPSGAEEDCNCAWQSR
jgi:hypothetical protein